MRERLALRMLSVVDLEELRSEHLIRGLPRIVRYGVTLPPYQVLEFASFAKESVSHDGLDLVFFLPIDHLGWWFMEVGPMFGSLLVPC